MRKIAKSLVTSLLVIFMICPLNKIYAQGRQITGKVISSDNKQPLAGVTVTVKGTKSATVTDVQGNYKITVGNNVTLIFTSVGYRTQEVAAGDQAVINIELAEEATAMSDVVVVGYQTVRRKDLTASVSSVNAKQLKDIPINSAAEALAGRLAGVQITGTEGSPNAEVLIRVRGGGSITQDNSPLFIIDGVQVENGLNTISPQDIETIDVLKDASATAIYGSRGANGVVIITTKGGKNTRPVINYNGFFGISKLGKELKVMKPYDFIAYQYERSRQGAYNNADSSNFAQQYGRTWDTLKNYKDYPFIDWQNEMFGRNALSQTHNISLTGGNDVTQYNLSLTSNKEDGLMLGSGFTRYLASFKFDHNFSKALKIGFDTRYNNTQVVGAGTSSTGSVSTNRLRQSVKYRPLLIAGQEIDDYDPAYAAQTNANSASLVNPILLNQAEYRKSYSNTTNLSGYIDLKLTGFLSFRTTAGVNITNTRQNAYDDTITNNSKLNGSTQPLASIGTTQNVIINNSNVLTFSNANLKGSFSEKNRITVLAGQEIYNNKTIGQNLLAKLFPVGIGHKKALANLGLGTAYTNPSQPASFETEEKLSSFFGRINYDFDNRYLMSASVRADGSSKFAEGNKWGYFPSGSVAWRISNEKFFDALKSIINDLKLRISYGKAGNNRIPNFLYLTQLAANTQYWLNDQLVTAYGNTTLANPDLIWESTVSKNLGVDISFLKNRFQLTVDVYRNTTKDLLVNVPLPGATGYTFQVQNVGSTLNKGVEAQLNATIMQNKNFSWNANFNMSFNKNKVLSLGTYQKFFLVNSGWGFSNTPSDYIVRVGDPVGAMWGFETDGYYKVEDFDYNTSTGAYTLKTGVPSNAGITSIAMPGAIKFKDLNGDGLINDNDKTIIGVAQPKVFGGLNQQFSYKGFDLSIFINYQFGNDVYNANKLEFTTGYTPNANLLAIMNDRWRTVDDNGTPLERVVTIGTTQTVIGVPPAQLAAANANAKLWMPSTSSTSFVLHSWAIEKGDFVRINNITLGYTLPAAINQKIKIQRARIYFTANNVAVITNYSGYDPEVSTRRGNPTTPGVDYSAYPRGRSFIFGINLTL